MTPPFEPHVRAEIQRFGPLEAHHRLIAANNALIRAPELGNGRTIAAARTAIYTELAAAWAERQQLLQGYERPFALVALGGTGRAEMTPCSDTDFAFLFDDAIEDNPFLLELQRQVLHSDEFQREYGFRFEPLPFGFEDIPKLEGKQLNSFLDLRAVYDPTGLAERFRARIRASYDPFEQFLHVQRFWRERWEKSAAECERLDRFDIKNEGLRVFLAGVWTLGGEQYVHSHDVYKALKDPQDLEAYGFLLRIRAFVHLRRPRPGPPRGGGNHAEDVLEFQDFISFGELLGPEADEAARFEFDALVRARLLSARRRVAQFTAGVIGGALMRGRERKPGSAIVYGLGGLRLRTSIEDRSPRERSSAALSLLLAAQQYGVAIDRAELQGTFRNASEWLVPVPELSALFYERRGSLAASFEFLSQLDGAEDRLFPGYAKFEASLDERVLTERTHLRSALEREKMQALEAMLEKNPPEGARRAPVAEEAQQLDADHLAAVKLALKTKRLPLTPEDVIIRGDTKRPLHERFSTGFSDIPLVDYYTGWLGDCEFTPETLRITRFLVANRRAFKERAEAAFNDSRQVDEFVALCREESLLRALWVFTCADRAVWQSASHEPTRWFNAEELYHKALTRFRPGRDTSSSLKAEGYSPDALEVMRDFGDDFFSGVYRRHANRFGPHLVRLAQDPSFSQPKVTVLRDGPATILGVATRDYRGLAASISGALWRCGIPLRQAHLFSAMNHGLALDFFHVAATGKVIGAELTRTIEQAILRQQHISPEDEAALPAVGRNIRLEEWRPDLYCLRAETDNDVGALIYVLAFAVFRTLGGNVFGLTAHAGRSGGWVSVYHSLPPGRTLDEARDLLRRRF